MLIPSGEGEGMVNSQLVTQGNFNSPSRGLAVVVKKRIPKHFNSSDSMSWTFKLKISTQHFLV